MAIQARGTINSIRWFRCYLIVSAPGCSSEVQIINKAGDCHDFCSVPYVTHEDELALNIANTDHRSLLGKGTWSFVDSSTGDLLRISDDVLFAIEDFNRSFFYRKNTRQYSIRFFSSKMPDGDPSLHFEVSYFKQDAKPRRDISAIKLAKRCMNLYYQICTRLSRKNGKRIMFMTENGTELGGNLRAIYSRMLERELDSQFSLSCSTRNIFQEKSGVLSWLKMLRMIAKQDYIFVEDYVPIFAAIELNPQTKLIQVWHAGFGFKLVGFGRFGISESPNPFASCHRKYAYALVGNKDLKPVYSEVFGIDQNALLATGMPRLDHFLDAEEIAGKQAWFVERFNFCAGRKVVLFAPTYRGGNQREAYYDYERIDFAELHRFCKLNNCTVLFKMHRFITTRVPIPKEYRDLFIDVSDCEINDLFYSIDVLVTDYSSCFYDYLLLKKPVVFYVYDEAYYCATRGVHRRLKDIAPGPVCHSFEDVVAALGKCVAGKNDPRPEPMLIDRCALRDGLASDRAIDFILFGSDKGNL